MSKNADFLVLGGGMIGCATAYYLSRGGASVTVLERGDTAFGTAGASGGLVNWITCAPSQMDLFMRSQAMLENLQQELEADFELNYNSYNMQIISNEIEWTASEQLVKDFKLPGFEAHLIDSYESHQLEPCVTDDMLGSIYVPRVHYLNPIKLALAYRRAAERHGAKFVNEAEVTALLRDGAAVTGARTPKGDYSAAVTINCTGVWSDKVSAMAGVDAPIHPIRGEFVITEPTEHFCNTTISSAVPDHRTAPGAVQPERHKVQPRLLGGTDHDRRVHHPRHEGDGLRPRQQRNTRGHRTAGADGGQVHPAPR